MRNSSLVKWSSAENSTGLKLVTEAADAQFLWDLCVVGERSRAREAAGEPRRGGSRSKNVARAFREIRKLVDARCDASWPEGRRVPDAIPPRKTSRQDARARTPNRHRWTSRKY